MKLIISTGYVFIVLFLDACKKEDRTSPVITLLQPSSALTVHVGETIHVEARISDNENLKTVSVQLNDGNNRPSGSPVLLHPNVSSYYLSTDLLIDNLHLSGGLYHLRVEADDGHTTTDVYQEINVLSLPLLRKSVFVFTKSGSNSTEILTLDTVAHLVQPFKTLSGDFTGSSISSYYQKIFSCGQSTGSFVILDAELGTASFSIPPVPPMLAPTFQYLHFKDELNFISFYAGDIKGYDYLGNIRFHAEQQGYFRPGALLKTADYLLAETYYTGVSQNRISVFFYPGGTPRQEVLLDFDVISMYQKSADEMLVFGMRNGTALIEKYSISTNIIQWIRDFGPTRIHQIEQLSVNEYFISTENGLLYYAYNTNLVSPLISTPVYGTQYDLLQNEIFLREAHLLRVLDANGLNEKYNVPTSDSILDIQILYNL